MAAALLWVGDTRVGCRWPAQCATSDGTNALAQTPRCAQGQLALGRTPAGVGRWEVLLSRDLGVQVQKGVKSVS